MPDPLTTTSNFMYLKFVTDGSVQNQGFEASYEISEGGNSPQLLKSHHCVITYSYMYVKFVTDGSVQNQGFEASYEISEGGNSPQLIRIYPECEGRIEKSVPRITVWHYEACCM